MARTLEDIKLHDMILDLALAVNDIQAIFYLTGSSTNPQAAEKLDKLQTRLDSIMKTSRELAKDNG